MWYYQTNNLSKYYTVLTEKNNSNELEEKLLSSEL